MPRKNVRPAEPVGEDVSLGEQPGVRNGDRGDRATAWAKLRMQSSSPNVRIAAGRRKDGRGRYARGRAKERPGRPSPLFQLTKEKYKKIIKEGGH